MRAMLVRVRRFYGAHPLHLLALLGCFALAGYAAVHTAADADWPLVLVWFLAAVVGHDLVLFPLYALADRTVAGLARLLPKRRSAGRPLVPPLNYVRIPALGAGLTLLLFLPGIIRQGAVWYASATGQTQQPFLGRWLLLAASMFGISAVLYAVRLRLAGRPARAAIAEMRRELRPGERVLTFAYDTAGSAGAVITTDALHYRDGDGWLRIDWADVGEVAWHPDDSAAGTLVVSRFGTGTPSRIEIPLPDPADLVDTAHVLVAATVLVTTPIDLAGGGHAVLTVRRRRDELAWWVRVPDGTDPADPRIVAEVDAALAAVRADLGLPAPGSP